MSSLCNKTLCPRHRGEKSLGEHLKFHHVMQCIFFEDAVKSRSLAVGNSFLYGQCFCRFACAGGLCWGIGERAIRMLLPSCLNVLRSRVGHQEFGSHLHPLCQVQPLSMCTASFSNHACMLHFVYQIQHILATKGSSRQTWLCKNHQKPQL